MVAAIVDDGRRGAGRSARRRSRRAGARRRLRQRQRARSRRRGAPGATRSASTSFPPCSSAAASAPPPSASRSSSSRATPPSCPSAMASSTSSISIFGAMFAPDQEQAAAELLRVCKPGRPDRHGQLGPRRRASARCSRSIAKHAPPPPGVHAAGALGHRGARCASCSATASPTCSIERRTSRQPFRSIDHYLEIFRTYFGPIKLAFERVGPEGEAALERRPARASWSECNTAGDRAFVLEPEYLQVIATRALATRAERG